MHYETLLLIQGTVLFMSMAIILVAWRTDRALRGVADYAAGTTLLAVATLGLAIFRSNLDLATVLTNILDLAAFVLMRFGLLQMLGRPRPSAASYWRASILIVALGVLMAGVSFGATYSARFWRILFMSSYIAIVSAIIAADQFRTRTDIASAPRAFVACAFLVMGLANAVRVIWMILDPIAHVEQFPSRYELVFLLLTILSSFAITAGVVLIMSGRLLARLDQQASNDPLTNTLNRRGFDVVSRTTLARAAREGASSALLVLDLDHFKKINDQFGHAVGDLVLREFAAVAAASLRAHDLFARFGGEEFVAIISDGGEQHAQEAAERVRKAWEHHNIRCPAGVFRTTVSIGVAPLDLHAPHPIEHAYHCADAALYRAKEAGRNRVELAQAA